MPEQLLDDSEIGASVEELSGERVSKGMRTDALQLPTVRGRTRHDMAHTPDAQTLAIGVEEERPLVSL